MKMTLLAILGLALLVLPTLFALPEVAIVLLGTLGVVVLAIPLTYWSRSPYDGY